MATPLDLQEQEQLDELKHFWKQYGNLILTVLTLTLGAYAAWNGWNWWQREQALKAAGMFEAFDQAAGAADLERATRVFGDLKERFPASAFAEQAGLELARLQLDKGRRDEARATLGWVGENAAEVEYRAGARLRLAGMMLDEKKHDEALKQLDGIDVKPLEALISDRRGDILQAQGKRTEAIQAYRKAWDGMDKTLDYRRLIEAKLTALGAAPDGAAAVAGAGAAR